MLKTYELLPFRLDEGVCNECVKTIFKMKELNLTTFRKTKVGEFEHDIPGDPAFDQLCELFLEPFSQFCGVKLVPCFSYVRLYKRGDRLDPHLDRESCEYSITMTLGYSGDKPWPIYASTDPENAKIESFHLDVGQGLAYKGCEIYHWRDELEMDWQVQMFFHYVDENGPYAHNKYDGRGGLAHHILAEKLTKGQIDGNVLG